MRVYLNKFVRFNFLFMMLWTLLLMLNRLFVRYRIVHNIDNIASLENHNLLSLPQ